MRPVTITARAQPEVQLIDGPAGFFAIFDREQVMLLRCEQHVAEAAKGLFARAGGLFSVNCLVVVRFLTG